MNHFLHIGIDDTDSPRKGCTTYIAALLVEKLNQMNLKFIDYPHLVRLNPNVPWKTRGNGAICLRVYGEEETVRRVRDVTIEIVEREADLRYSGTDPGIVLYYEETVPSEFQSFAERTLHDIVSIDEALGLIKKFGGEAFAFKKGRGVIGALAAIGSSLQGDHTYEFITYRTPKNCGTPRKVDADSVLMMNEKFDGLTFNNVDLENRRVLITPRGPDPVFYGIRGENPRAVREAGELVKPLEEVERWVIFKTNQGTDAHLRKVSKISQIQPYRPVIVKGEVSSKPRTIPGRHVIFSIVDKSGSVDCAAYEPTKKFRNIVRKLILGDLIEAHGGVRPASSTHPLTINLEKINIIHLVPKFVLRSPICEKCGKSMESMGKDKGYRCKRCGFRDREAEKIVIESKRKISLGLHVPPLRAQRHLTKPLLRYGKEKTGVALELEEPWHKP